MEERRGARRKRRERRKRIAKVLIKMGVSQGLVGEKRGGREEG